MHLRESACMFDEARHAASDGTNVAVRVCMWSLSTGTIWSVDWRAATLTCEHAQIPRAATSTGARIFACKELHSSMSGAISQRWRPRHTFMHMCN
eukprot:5642689-Pleurochrysis_carterae.AAC.1